MNSVNNPGPSAAAAFALYTDQSGRPTVMARRAATGDETRPAPIIHGGLPSNCRVPYDGYDGTTTADRLLPYERGATCQEL